MVDRYCSVCGKKLGFFTDGMKCPGCGRIFCDDHWVEKGLLGREYCPICGERLIDCDY